MTMYIGGEGNDTILGSSLGDTIKGRGGVYDVLHGRAGNDVIDGGDGYDQIYGEAGDDHLLTGFGSARVFGGDGSDTIALKFRMGTTWNDNSYDPSNGQTVYCDAGNGNDTVFITNSDLATGSLIDGGIDFDTLYMMTGDGQYRSDFTNNIWSSIHGFEEWNLFVYPNYPGDLFNYGTIRGFSDQPVVLDNSNFNNIAGRRIMIHVGNGTTIDASADSSGSIDVAITLEYTGYPVFVMGGSGNDRVIADDKIETDTFRGNGGDDYFDGKDGVDVSIFSGNATDYVIKEILYNTFTVHDMRGIDGTDQSLMSTCYGSLTVIKVSSSRECIS